MENQIYRVELSQEKKLEFWISNTNTLNPSIPQKEIGIMVFDKGDFQLDGSLDMQEIDSLINYLQDAKRHCERFNSEQKKLHEPTNPTE